MQRERRSVLATVREKSDTTRLASCSRTHCTNRKTNDAVLLVDIMDHHMLSFQRGRRWSPEAHVVLYCQGDGSDSPNLQPTASILGRGAGERRHHGMML